MNYVQDYYKVRTYLTTYHNIFGPINGKDLWPSSGNAILLPPDVKRKAGRPKKGHVGSSVRTNMAGDTQPKVRHCVSVNNSTNQMHTMMWRGSNVYLSSFKRAASSNNATKGKIKVQMKAASWPLVLKKDGKASDSPPSDQDSHGFVATPNDQISSESVSSKPTIPLDIFKEQVVEFMQRLRALDSKMPSEIRNIVFKEPVLDLVQECHSIVEHEFEKEFSKLEAIAMQNWQNITSMKNVMMA
ncbi:hypothetical protein RHMOL_Rhmol06G0274000 [Rhododendron molle]|uniref:Uncharacterized protein n=1 Tax=Rhododendron molle TaxID=49168 RepID=A0ACC0NGM1_RHOML|nr:hypothetical protein RHMOL_Rhmol06G0274000 [Rhododendron molle]